MARATKEEALETRNRIIAAAADVFHARGLAHSSLADVAEAANVTRGAIYWHFKNKSDLFDAICERVCLPMEAMMAASADEREPDPLGQLRNAWLFLLQEAVRNPHTRKALDIIFLKCELVDRADPIWVRQNASYLQGMENMQHILRNAAARGQLPPDLDTKLAAVALHGSMVGLINSWLFAPTSFDLDNDAERLIDACLDSLRYAPTLRLKKIRHISSASAEPGSPAIGTAV
jgi:TetR/AcrR family acrAB operon transcriptional repressor